VDALDGVGEKQRFEACRKAMDRLTDVRREGWLKIQCVREQLALCKLDPRRTSARNREEGLKGLQHLMWIAGKSKRIADEVKRSLDGWVAPVWIEEYVATRLSPLQDELAALTAQAEALDTDSSNTKKSGKPQP
jgi:hypothetical protein